jgi:hypothetical protein
VSISIPVTEEIGGFVDGEYDTGLSYVKTSSVTITMVL